MLNQFQEQIHKASEYLKENVFFKNDIKIPKLGEILDEYEAENKNLRLAERITPVSIFEDGRTVATKNSGLVQVIKFEGKDYSGLSSDEQDRLFVYRKTLFEIISNDVSLTFHYFRKKVAVENIEKYETENEFAKKITDIWNQNFKDTYRTEMYLVVRVPIENDLGLKIKNPAKFVSTSLEREKIKINKAKEYLDSQVGKIEEILKQYDPTVLEYTQDNKSELIPFFDYLINNDLSHTGKRLNFNANSNIGEMLSLSDVTFDKSQRLVTLHRGNKRKFCKVLAIKHHPLQTNEQIFDLLLRSKHQFNITQHILPIDREFNKLFIKKKIDQLETMAGMGFMKNRFENLLEAGESIEEGTRNFHNHIVLIHVFSNNLEKLNKSVSDIEGILNYSGITLIEEGIALELAYWSNLPDYEKVNSARKAKISTENLSDFANLGNSLEGLNKCPFGDSPVTNFKTTQNTNYSFSFHKSVDKEALGHTMIVGGTGTGKTTLIAFLLMNCLKYPDLRILCFDSLNGLKIPVTAFGGEYVDASSQKKLNLNPFLLPDNERNREFLKTFLEILTRGINGSEEKDLINSIVRMNYEASLTQKEKSARNLSIVSTVCGIPKKNKNGENITARIADWLPETKSRYGDIFNADKNSLSFEKRIVGFDMVDVLSKPEILTPLSSYIFHSFDEYIRSNPSPHICFIDEMATYIQNETFSDFINKSAQEWRKRRGIIIGAIQNLSSLVESKHGKKIIANLATYILFPDVSANKEHYMGELGLNDSEFNWIKHPNPLRQVMLKRRGGESVILDVSLASLGEYLKLFSSGHEYVKKLSELEASKKYQTSSQLINKYLEEVR